MTRIPPNPCYKCERRHPACSANRPDSDAWHEAFYNRLAEIKVLRDADSVRNLKKFYKEK